MPRPKPRAVPSVEQLPELEPVVATSPRVARPSIEPDGVAPPKNPTLEEIWKLIDARIPPQIAVRLSSIPPPESKPSMPVRAAKATGRWTKWAMAAIGVLALVGEVFADIEKYRGPISQAVVILARVLDAHEAGAPSVTPSPEPEPPPAP